jgi:hypothetical protein
LEEYYERIWWKSNAPYRTSVAASGKCVLHSPKAAEEEICRTIVFRYRVEIQFTYTPERRKSLGKVGSLRLE